MDPELSLEDKHGLLADLGVDPMHPDADETDTDRRIKRVLNALQRHHYYVKPRERIDPDRLPECTARDDGEGSPVTMYVASRADYRESLSAAVASLEPESRQDNRLLSLQDFYGNLATLAASTAGLFGVRPATRLVMPTLSKGGRVHVRIVDIKSLLPSCVQGPGEERPHWPTPMMVLLYKEYDDPRGKADAVWLAKTRWIHGKAAATPEVLRLLAINTRPPFIRIRPERQRQMARRDQ